MDAPLVPASLGGVVLACDPGTANFGWALMRVPDQVLIAAGAARISPVGPTYVQVAHNVCAFLEQTYAIHPFDAVVVEIQLREYMIAVMQSVICWCAMRGVPIRALTAQQWRWCAGVRAAGSHAGNKAFSVAHLKAAHGYMAKSPDEADAVLMALGACVDFSLCTGQVPSAE